MIRCTKDTSSECVLLCFLLFSVTGSADVVHFVCLLYFIYLLEGEGAGGGAYVHAVFCCCSCPVCVCVCVRACVRACLGDRGLT